MYLIIYRDKNIIGVADDINGIRRALMEYYITCNMFRNIDSSKIIIEYVYDINCDEYELCLRYEEDHESSYKAIKVKKY